VRCDQTGKQKNNRAQAREHISEMILVTISMEPEIHRALPELNPKRSSESSRLHGCVIASALTETNGSVTIAGFSKAMLSSFLN
jgi:hypothetical protein